MDRDDAPDFAVGEKTFVAKVGPGSYVTVRYGDKGLKSHTVYYYRVRAVDRDGHAGEPSDVCAGTTRESPREQKWGFFHPKSRLAPETQAEFDVRFRQWLEQKYGVPGALAKAWGDPGLTAFAQVVTPDRFPHAGTTCKDNDFVLFCGDLSQECAAWMHTLRATGYKGLVAQYNVSQWREGQKVRWFEAFRDAAGVRVTLDGRLDADAPVVRWTMRVENPAANWPANYSVTWKFPGKDSVWRRHSYSFCPAASGTRAFFLETVRRLHGLGIDIVQMDQTTGGAGDTCASGTHGPPAGRGAYQSQAFRALLSDMRQYGKSLSPAFMLAHEECHEELIPCVCGRVPHPRVP